MSFSANAEKIARAIRIFRSVKEKELTASEGSSSDVNTLLDAMQLILGCRNDAALSRKLGMSPPQISKMRHGTLAVGASFLVRVHEETGLTTSEVRAMMGDLRPKFYS